MPLTDENLRKKGILMRSMVFFISCLSLLQCTNAIMPEKSVEDLYYPEIPDLMQSEVSLTENSGDITASFLIRFRQPMKIEDIEQNMDQGDCSRKIRLRDKILNTCHPLQYNGTARKNSAFDISSAAKLTVGGEFELIIAEGLTDFRGKLTRIENRLAFNAGARQGPRVLQVLMENLNPGTRITLIFDQKLDLDSFRLAQNCQGTIAVVRVEDRTCYDPIVLRDSFENGRHTINVTLAETLIAGKYAVSVLKEIRNTSGLQPPTDSLNFIDVAGRGIGP